VKQEKAWGTTEALLRNPFVHVHRIHVKKGGFCSIHKHDARSNMFIVVKGVLTVKLHNADGSMVHEGRLHPGDMVAVPPGEFHSFEAVTDVEAFEVYWPEEVRDEDITRLNEGGIATQEK
jgi:mannose-6-phosphate isomerase-like protein (cupin superfamily)